MYLDIMILIIIIMMTRSYHLIVLETLVQVSVIFCSGACLFNVSFGGCYIDSYFIHCFVHRNDIRCACPVNMN